jgi:ferredoxin
MILDVSGLVGTNANIKGTPFQCPVVNGTARAAERGALVASSQSCMGGARACRVYSMKYVRADPVCSLSIVMTYVIVGSCIKDDSCIEVCPVDCIHPKPGAPDFETAEQLYIDPELCIDCDACVEACPIDAIFAEFEIPEKYDYALDLNAQFFADWSTADRTAA